MTVVPAAPATNDRHVALSLGQRAGVWWTILRIALAERLAYRGDFMLGTLMRFLPIITQIFLWWAVFAAVEQSQSQSGATESGPPQLAGFAFHDMVAYYLLTMVARAFSSMPGLSTGIARQVRDGEIKKFLIQPVDYLGFLLISRVAHKLAYYTVALLPFALVFYLCRGYFQHGWPEPTVLAAFFISLILSFLIGFYLEACLGLIAFWFLEVSSLVFIYMLLNYFLSGHMFPLTMLPDSVRLLVDLLPFKYLAYTPSAIFLGKVAPGHVWREVAIGGVWLIGLAAASRLLYRRGLRRYSGFGG